ncbi:hypothetical protein DVJ77_14475 [Dyella tabacisoli]|uniref:Uncharacterized protein n=1 Tax=Dyella tabacisoli TaxID=2282381 RepID=A0A369UK47_9GAMM|nr:hypothetical protein DVJ77_14475 [Dyella tabacisoli]
MVKLSELGSVAGTVSAKQLWAMPRKARSCHRASVSNT